MSRLITKSLKKLISSGDESSYINIAKDPYYIQINGGKGQDVIFIDAVANPHLDEKDYLSDDQIAAFKALQFEEEPRSGNFVRDFPIKADTVPEATAFIVEVLKIYPIDPHKAEIESDLE